MQSAGGVQADRASLQCRDPISHLQGLYKQMVETFKSLGVEAVPGVGQPFDPNYHDAIAREDNDELPDGTVLKEFRRGFRLGSTLLRPAMVQVPPPPLPFFNSHKTHTPTPHPTRNLNA